VSESSLTFIVSIIQTNIYKGLELAELHSKAVDYVKTGQPAQMPKRLRVAKWPHFIEKRFKPKSAIYHSEKILGRLYDRVESVDFVPQYDAPFDKRILRAYQLESSVLKAARQTKSKYDTAMRRIMAQQEIKTEFEVWSTFVLSKPRVGSDYKLQEEMALITGAFKDRFRLECIDRAGGKEFSVLGPFVAAMYKVTKEEMDIALAECRATKVVHGMTVPKRKMRPESMPLISFPWLFEKELSRIATGIEAMDEFEEIGFETADINKPHAAQGPKRHMGISSLPEDDVITQDNGVIIHRGEVLDLFQDSASDGDIDDDYEDVRSPVHASESEDLCSPVNVSKSEGLRSPVGVSDSLQNLVDIHLAANLEKFRTSPPPINARTLSQASNHTGDNSKEGAAQLSSETEVSMPSVPVSMPSVPNTEPGSEVETDEEQIEEIVEEEEFEAPAINKLSSLLDL
jgi:RNA-dependent RNA polymerase